MPRRGTVPTQKVLLILYINSIAGHQVSSTHDERRQARGGPGIMYEALNNVQGQDSGRSLKVFKKAIDTVKPVLEVKSRRVGGSNYPGATRSIPHDARLWLCGGLIRLRSRPLRAHDGPKLAGEIMDAAGQRAARSRRRTTAQDGRATRPLPLSLVRTKRVA